MLLLFDDAKPKILHSETGYIEGIYPIRRVSNIDGFANIMIILRL